MRAHGVDVMASLSGELSRLLETSTHLSSALQGLSHVVDKADSAVSLQAVAARIGILQDLLQQWNQRLGDGGLRGSFRTVDFALQDLRKTAVKFRMIAMQAHIEMKAEPDGDTSKFTDDMRATPVEISGCVDALKDSAHRVQRAHDAALTECSKSLDEIDKIAAVIAAAMASIQDDRTTVAKAKIDVSTVIDRFQVDMRRHSVSIISSFQFSDFFAQRMEHVAQLLSQPASRAQACNAVAKAQILALISDGQEIVRSIHTAIDQMSFIQAEFTAAYGDHEKNVRRVMEGQQVALVSVMRHRDDALAALDKAFTSTHCIHQAIEESQDRFQKIKGLSGLIDMAAINARLRSNRMVHAQKTMAVLSSAVLDTAQESREVISTCAKMLNLIAMAHDAGISDRLKENVHEFRKDYDDCRNGMSVAMSELTKLSQFRVEAMASLARLTESLIASRSVADRMVMVFNALSDLSDELADVPPNFDWPDLADIVEIYTMESERVVHNKVLNLTDELPHHITQRDDLDLVFF